MHKMMKRVLMASGLVVAALCFNMTSSKAADVALTPENISDAYVLANLMEKDTDNDGILTDAEAESVTSMLINVKKDDVSCIIKYFPKLKNLTLYPEESKSVKVNNMGLDSIAILSKANAPVSLIGTAPKQVWYVIDKINVKTVDFTKVSGYKKVVNFLFYSPKTTKVILANPSVLKQLTVYNTAIKKMDISKAKNLEFLDFSNNKKMTSIDVTKNKKLTTLSCYDCKLSTLNISKNTLLKDIGVSGNNLKKIDTSKNKKITRIVAENNKITTLKIAAPKLLTELSLSNNKLTAVDLKKYAHLERLRVAHNKLKTLDISKNKKLSELNCSYNSIKKLSLKTNTKLTAVKVEGTSLKMLSFSKCKNLNFVYTGKNYSVLKGMKSVGKDLHTIGLYLPKNKTFSLKKIIPGLKNYTFSSTTEKLVTSNGKVTMPNYKKDEGLFVRANKGAQTILIMVNYLDK